MRILLALAIGVTGVLATLLALAQQAPPSRDVDDYVLVGLMRVSLNNGVHVVSGNVGVNSAAVGLHEVAPGNRGTLLVSHDGMFSNGAAPVADTVRLSNGVTVGDVYANHLFVARGVYFHFPPIHFAFFGSGRTLFASLPQLPAFSCAGSAFGAFVLPTPTSLTPGAYGFLLAKDDVDVELSPGTYRFANIRLGKRATLLADGPVTVNVCGDLRLSNAARIGFKKAGSAKDFSLNVAGRSVAFSHGNDVTAIVRAPNANLRLGAQQQLRGQFVANAVSGGPRVEMTCETGSTHCSPATATTTPRSSTTTTTTSSTSTTTLSRTTARAVEVCGNCLDDDGDGLTDFEDPACCTDRQIFPMAIDGGRIRPHGRTSLLRLRSLLAAQGLADVNPLRQDVFLQIRAERGDEVFCAKVPASRFVANGHGTFRFRDRKHSVASASGIDRLAVRIARNGSVRFRAFARNAGFTSPPDRPLNVTVSFRNPLEAEGGNRCSTTQGVRTNRRGALRVP